MSRVSNMSTEQLAFDFDTIAKSIHLLTPQEIFNGANEELLLKLSEDNRIDRKLAKISAKTLGESICMWANTGPNGGVVAIGQADDGTITGVASQSQQHINELEKAGWTHSPDARVALKRVPVEIDGVPDFVLLMHVAFRHDKVVQTTKGDSWLRRGDTKCRLTRDEIELHEADRGQRSVEQEPCGLEYPTKFSTDSIKAFTASVTKMRGLTGEHSDEEILVHRKLGHIDSQGKFVPNVACALLFAKDPGLVVPGCAIRFQKYEGTERETGSRRNVVKDVTLDGQVIPDLIAEADKLIQSQIREFSQLGPKGRFFTQPEYPQPAWYEAIVNACVHRSYELRNMNIFIRMFDDRIVFESPGPFPASVTPESIYEVHHRRNFFLMDAMFYMDYVKCENEGTRRMRDEMVAMELPAPEFEQKEIGTAMVRVTLRNLQDQRRQWIDKDAVDVVGQAVFQQLNQNERRCVNFCSEYKKITVADASRLLGVDWKTGKKVLVKLVDMKLMTWESRFPNDSKAHYRLNSPTHS